MDSIRLYSFQQMLLTVFLAALSWSFYARLRRQEFFGWWVWAWTSFAVFSTLGAAVLHLPLHPPALRVGLLLATMIFGFVQVPLLVFAGSSLRSPGAPTVAARWAGVGLALAAAVLCVAASLTWSDQPLTSFSLRHAPRTLALAGALLFCSWIFLARWRTTRSKASAVTGTFCLLYATTQGMYSVAMIGHALGQPAGSLHPLLDLAHLLRSPLYFLDLISSCGIALGMGLLLVEEHRHSETALAQSVSRGREIAERNLALEAEIAERLRAEEALRGAEAALRESQSRYRLATAAGSVGVWDLDLETRDMYVDPALKALLGYEDGEIRNHLDDWIRHVHPNDLERVNAEVQAHLDGARPYYEVEHRMVHKDGSIRWFLARGSAVRDADSRPRRLVGTDTDVTARKEAAEALHEVQERNRAILEALPDLMFLQTRDGIYLDFHARDPRQLLVKPEEFLGRNMMDVLPPSLAGEFLRAFAQVMESGGPCAVEYFLPIQGELRHYEARVVRCDRDNVLSIVRDITERRRAEEEARELRDELAHVGRVSVLGALTGSLAHEINQPLAAIMANAQAALRMLAGPRPALAELRDTLGDIVADNRRAGDVLQRLRSLLRKGSPEYTTLDVNTTIEEVVRLVGSDILGRRVTVNVVLAPEAPAVHGDRVQLQQVVLNLLVNAFDAVEEAEVGARWVTLQTACVDERVVVSVSDRGVGVPEERLSHIFEPFYTTKTEGMGLGLSICRAIMAAHGGDLRGERNPDGGMTFSFSLPQSPSVDASAKAPAGVDTPAPA